MAIGLGQGSEAAQAANGVFDDDALAGEGRVVEPHPAGGRGLPRGLRRGVWPVRVQRVEARIAQVAAHAHSRGAGGPAAPTLGSSVRSAVGPRHAGGHVDDLARSAQSTATWLLSVCIFFLPE